MITACYFSSRVKILIQLNTSLNKLKKALSLDDSNALCRFVVHGAHVQSY